MRYCIYGFFPNATAYANKREAEYWLSGDKLNAATDDAKRTLQASRTTITTYINAGKIKTFEKHQIGTGNQS